MKRFLVLCIAVVACYAAVTGSIAYFTDSVETTNRVASGNLHVVQHEYERVKNNDGYTATLKAFTQEKPLYPAVKGDPVTKESVTHASIGTVSMPTNIRNYVDKIVTAENKGSLNMFVRTYIAVPSFSASDDTAPEKWIHLDVNKSADGWKFENDEAPIIYNALIDDHAYDIYMVTYQQLVQPNTTTPPSLLGFYMDSHVTNDGDGLIFKQDEKTYDLGNGNNMKILVATVASQAAVFNSVDEAMAATYPQDKDGKEVYHPWLKNFHFVGDQDALKTALAAAQNQYDTIISLSDGTYTLPATLPAGLRITGAGAVVMIDVTTLSANDVEFDHVTFIKPVTFTGWGSFEEVTFVAGTTISATHDTVLVDCVNPPAASDKVSVVTSLPATTK